MQNERVMARIIISYLRKTPPRRLAFKHSGGDSRLCTSATVTLYLLVLLSNDNRPGTEQNTSEGCAFPVSIAFSLLSDGFMSATRPRIMHFTPDWESIITETSYVLIYQGQVNSNSWLMNVNAIKRMGYTCLRKFVAVFVIANGRRLQFGSMGV